MKLYKVPLILSVIKRLRRDKATLIRIALAWSRQYWHTDLYQLSIWPPIALPLVKVLLSQKLDNSLHPNLHSLTSWEGWSLAEQWGESLLAECPNHLACSRKDSTRATYAAKWKMFSAWAELSTTHQLSTKNIAIRHMIDYLLHLKSAGLSHSSIRVHLASISAINPPIDGFSDFSSLGV